MQILALFHDVQYLAEAVTDLRQNEHVANDDITAITGAPYHAEALGLDHPHSIIPQVAFVFWIIGGLLGFGLAAGTMMAYPLVVGGKPIPSIPPSLIITYEVAMLTAIVVTFGRTIYEFGLPSFKPEPYDVRIGAGNPAIAVKVPSEAVANRLMDRLRSRGGLVDVSIFREDEVK